MTQSVHAEVFGGAPPAMTPARATEEQRNTDAEHAPAEQRAPSHRWSVYDYALVTLGFLLSLAISVRLGQGHIFWEDEMLGWMMLRDPSWSHMIRSWKLGADGGGFSFYLTGRAWFALFGASAVTFRLYSAMCFGIAFALTWAAARRAYRTVPVAFALFLVWFLCPVLVAHMAEGRFYGLLMASVAATLYLYVRGTGIPGREKEAAPAAFCAVVVLAHSFLITSHLLGVVYSFFILLTTVVTDRMQRRLRPRLYLSIVVTWLLLIPSRESILASARVGKPHFWTMQPTPYWILLAYCGYSLRIAMALLGLLALVLVTLVVSRRRRVEMVRSAKTRKPMYVATVTLLLVPIAFYLEGFVGPALFIDRYLLPVNVGLVLVIAEAITLLEPERWFGPRLWKPAIAVLGVGLAAVLLQYDFVYIRQYATQHWDYTADVTRNLPKGVPVVCEDVFSFTELMGRQSGSGVQYTYFLDWQNAIDAKTSRLEVTQYHLMENWKKEGYFPERIQYRNTFLQEHPYFLVLHTQEDFPASLTRPGISHFERTKFIGDPLVERFSADPEYQVKPYTVVKSHNLRENVYLVCRRDVTPCSVPLPSGAAG